MTHCPHVAEGLVHEWETCNCLDSLRALRAAARAEAIEEAIAEISAQHGCLLPDDWREEVRALATRPAGMVLVAREDLRCGLRQCDHPEVSPGSFQPANSQWALDWDAHQRAVARLSAALREEGT